MNDESSVESMECKRKQNYIVIYIHNEKLQELSIGTTRPRKEENQKVMILNERESINRRLQLNIGEWNEWKKS